MRKPELQDRCFLNIEDCMVISKAEARAYKIIFDHTDLKTHGCSLTNSAFTAIFRRDEDKGNKSKSKFCGKVLENLRRAGLIRVFLMQKNKRMIFCKQFYNSIPIFLALNTDYKELFTEIDVVEKEFDRTADEITLLYE